MYKIDYQDSPLEDEKSFGGLLDPNLSPFLENGELFGGHNGLLYH